MSRLAPLLSQKHRPGQREVVFPDRPEHYFIDGHGVLNAKGMTITARDPETGRPIGVAAKDEDAVLRALGPNKPDDAIIKTHYEPPVTGRAAEQEIIDVRFDAVRRAEYLTLQESDDYVRKTLSNAALPHGEKCITVREAVRSTLIQLYEQRLEDESLQKRFNTIVDKRYQ